MTSQVPPLRARPEHEPGKSVTKGARLRPCALTRPSGPEYRPGQAPPAAAAQGPAWGPLTLAWRQPVTGTRKRHSDTRKTLPGPAAVPYTGLFSWRHGPPRGQGRSGKEQVGKREIIKWKTEEWRPAGARHGATEKDTGTHGRHWLALPPSLTQASFPGATGLLVGLRARPRVPMHLPPPSYLVNSF